MNTRRGTFVDRVLDGHARIDQLDAEVSAWLAGARRRPLHEVLGLDAQELELVAATPDALRYVIHARRFGRSITSESLRGQGRVRAHAMRRASESVDPHELAEVEQWIHHVDVAAEAAAGPREPSRA